MVEDRCVTFPPRVEDQKVKRNRITGAGKRREDTLCRFDTIYPVASRSPVDAYNSAWDGDGAVTEGLAVQAPAGDPGAPRTQGLHGPRALSRPKP